MKEQDRVRFHISKKENNLIGKRPREKRVKSIKMRRRTAYLAFLKGL